jgi:hypothetical protein
VGEGVDKLTVGVLRQPLQHHRATGHIANQVLQLIAAMGWNLRVSMQRQAVHAGTARPREPWRLTLMPKPGADAPHRLARPLPTGDALLHGGCHGAGERGLMIPQRIIPGGPGGLHARLQIP